MLPLVLAAHMSLFERVCHKGLVGTNCGLFLTGFFTAMVAQGEACYPEPRPNGDHLMDMEAMRKATLASVQERKTTEAKAIHSAIAKMYPCKEK